MYQNDAQRVLTGECRLSYCNLIQPRAPINGQGDPKSVSYTHLTLPTKA